MPNHVKNKITIQCENKERVKEVIFSILNGDGYFDFNNIVPMPKILNNTSEPNNSNAQECLKETGYSSWYNWSIDTWGTKWNSYDNKFPYERLDPKKWHMTYKGDYFRKPSKYRCYADRINKKRFKKFIENNDSFNTIEFETAWDYPATIISHLSKKFPDVTFEVLFVNEDLGSGCGTFVIKNNKRLKEDIAPTYSEQTKEERKKWMEFAFTNYRPETDPRSFGYNEEWEYDEAVETAWDKEQEENNKD